MKIKYSLLTKLCAANLTNKEHDFLLYISRYQDERGRIMGIYYRTVCAACKMSIQTFYNVLRTLKKKGIISYTQVNDDYDIVILDNDFSYEGAYQEGYINVSRSVFDSENFKNLRVNEKLLVLQLMKVTHENTSSYRIGTDKFYAKYTALLGVTKNILRTYLHSMRKFFSVGRKDGKYFITFLTSVFKSRRAESETNQYLGHVVKTDCRRSRIRELGRKAVEDTIQLVKQYRQEAREQGRDILRLIGECISASVEGYRHKTLNAKYVHKLIRQSLGLAK